MALASAELRFPLPVDLKNLLSQIATKAVTHDEQELQTLGRLSSVLWHFECPTIPELSRQIIENWQKQESESAQEQTSLNNDDEPICS